MNRQSRICAMCAHFSTKASPDQAAVGLGACDGFPDERHIAPFVRWDATPCVLFDRATDVAPRERYVAKQMARAAA